MSAHPTLRKFLSHAQTDKAYLDMAMNLILVQHGARQGYLFESANYENNVGMQKAIRTLNLIVRSVGLVQNEDPTARPAYPRFLITKQRHAIRTEADIARVLGFYCIGHDYGNMDVQRLTCVLTEKTRNVNMTTEVCEMERISMTALQTFYQNKASVFQRALRLYGPHLQVEYKLTTEYTRRQKLDKVINNDIQFVIDNADVFDDDLYNYFTESSRFVKALRDHNFSFVRQNWPTFRMIYLHWMQNTDTPEHMTVQQLYVRMQRWEDELLALNTKNRDIFT